MFNPFKLPERAPLVEKKPSAEELDKKVVENREELEKAKKQLRETEEQLRKGTLFGEQKEMALNRAEHLKRLINDTKNQVASDRQEFYKLRRSSLEEK